MNTKKLSAGSLHKNQNGFTILELMIATLVFSAVLLICSLAVVHIGRVYYKGIITNRTQDTTRKVIDDMSRSVQFSAGNIDEPDNVLTDDVLSLCVDRVRYTYFNPVNSPPQGSPGHELALVRSELAEGQNCEGAGSDEPDIIGGVLDADKNEVSMLGDNMRVTSFGIAQNGPVYDLNLVISYGDTDDLFDSEELTIGGVSVPFSICRGVNSSGQFCAVAFFSTTVKKRLGPT